MFSVYKQGRKITIDYLIFLIIYVVFIPLLISLAKDNFDKWTPVYSIFVCFLMTLVIWSDVYEFAVKEKKPMYKLDPSPHKGILIGLLGFAPFLILGLISIVFTDQFAEKLNFTPELIDIVNTAFFAPIYFLIAFMGKSIASFVAASLFVPVVCYVAYLLGHKGITKKQIITKVKSLPINQSKN